VDPQGSDIEDGRLTLLIVLALQRANPEQKKLLNANYGCEEPEKVEIVKQVCIYLCLNKKISKKVGIQKKNNEQKKWYSKCNFFLLPLQNTI
jgi:geranylgeranyl pyrophosphate synthase